MRLQLLGGLSAKRFLSQIWQTKPLLVRGAIPGFKGMVQAPELFALAARSDVESRLVRRQGRAWKLRHGPFSRTELARLPKSGWTRASYAMILHGRRVCKPKPLCDQCAVRGDCEYFETVVSRQGRRTPAAKTRGTRPVRTARR